MTLPRTDGPEAFTNVQEPGVDEPDRVKSDGRRLVALVQGALQVVDLTGPNPTRLARLEMQGWAEQLLLAGDRVMVFSHEAYPVPEAGPEPATFRPGMAVTVVNIAAPATPAVVARLRLEGSYVSARLVDGLVRLVVHSQPAGPTFETPVNEADQARSTAANRRAIQASDAEDWLPRYILERPGQPSVSNFMAECGAVLRPQQSAGLSTVSVLLNPADPRPADVACVLGGGSIAYASRENLYVATSRWTDPAGAAAIPPLTEIHRFAIDGGKPVRFLASGEVPGYLLNQFSLSEHAGHLRVASTTTPPPTPWGGAGPQPPEQSESRVTVLALTGPQMTPVGEVGGLGKGGTVQAVRFLGDRGYVVTFRQIDPLYVLDLGDPRRPALRAELKTPGFSSYLHPIGESLLLGVGQNVTEDGRTRLGTQVSVFDVSDPSAPVRRHAVTLPNTTSEAQWDHHAFLWLPGTQQLVLPLAGYGAEGDVDARFSGAVAWRWDQTGGFADETRLQHPVAQARILRSFAVNDSLYTVSDEGVMRSDLRSLSQQGWASFAN